MRQKRAVSLAAEVEVLRGAVEAARTLVEMHRQGGLEGEDCAGLAVDTLTLIVCRLRDLGRVARGEASARVLVAPHNQVASGTKAEGYVLKTQDATASSPA